MSEGGAPGVVLNHMPRATYRRPGALTDVRTCALGKGARTPSEALGHKAYGERAGIRALFSRLTGVRTSARGKGATTPSEAVGHRAWRERIGIRAGTPGERLSLSPRQTR